MTKKQYQTAVYRQIVWTMYFLKEINTERLKDARPDWNQVKMREYIRYQLESYVKDGVLISYNMKNATCVFDDPPKTELTDFKFEVKK